MKNQNLILTNTTSHVSSILNLFIHLGLFDSLLFSLNTCSHCTCHLCRFNIKCHHHYLNKSHVGTGVLFPFIIGISFVYLKRRRKVSPAHLMLTVSHSPVLHYTTTGTYRRCGHADKTQRPGLVYVGWTISSSQFIYHAKSVPIKRQGLHHVTF